MTNHINPIKGNIAVDPIFESDTYKTAGGLELIKPDQYKGRSTQGIVKYIGEGVRNINRGDYVFFSAYTGTLWAYKNELLILLPENKIVAKLDKGQEATEIPGLYFRGQFRQEEREAILEYAKAFHNLRYELVSDTYYIGRESFTNFVDGIIQATLDRDQYWQCNFEQVTRLIADALTPYATNELNPMNPENFQIESD